MPADPTDSIDAQRQFHTTRWSVVLAAGGDAAHFDARTALAALCESYWYPLYAFVRRRVDSVDEAQDLTQAFFTHLLEKRAIARADRDRGRFRAFLLTALKNFLANEWQRLRTEKRGGGRTPLSLDFEAGESKYLVEPSHDVTPEKLFERRWVLTLLDRVLETLRAEFDAAGRADHFEQFRASLVSGGDTDGADLTRAAEALGISHDAAKQAAYRMRKRYRQLFREEVARTVDDPSEVEDEVGRLLTSLAR